MPTVGRGDGAARNGRSIEPPIDRQGHRTRAQQMRQHRGHVGGGSAEKRIGPALSARSAAIGLGDRPSSRVLLGRMTAVRAGQQALHPGEGGERRHDPGLPGEDRQVLADVLRAVDDAGGLADGDGVDRHARRKPWVRIAPESAL